MVLANELTTLPHRPSEPLEPGSLLPALAAAHTVVHARENRRCGAAADLTDLSETPARRTASWLARQARTGRAGAPPALLPGQTPARLAEAGAT